MTGTLPAERAGRHPAAGPDDPHGSGGAARRLDWHVLLPAPRAGSARRWLVLGGGTPRLPEMAVELGLARAAAGVRGEAPADVVALLHGAREPVDEASRRLAPGGCLYWEVDRTSLRRLALTPARARRRLRRAGLAPVATYWVGPDWTRATRHVPLDPPGPLAWYLATIAVARGPVAAAAHAALRRLARLPAITGLVVPRFAIVAVAGEAPPAGVAGGASGAAPAAGPALLGAADMPDDVRASPVPPILVAGGDEAWSRLTLLAFGSGVAGPAAVVKVSRRPEDDQATRHEHDVLAELAGGLDAGLAATVPAPIALLREGPRASLVQGPVAGVAAFARLRRWPRRAARAWADLELAADWLAAFHARTTRLRALPGEPAWQEHVDQPLRRFAACFEVDEPARRLLERVAARAATVPSGLPIVLEHRDLGPWNVLVDGSRVGVIDWEVARDGPAMTDLVYAALHWTFVGRGATSEVDRRRELRRLLVGDGPDGGALRVMLQRYGDQVGVDRALIPSLVVLALVGQALDRHGRLAGAGATTRSTNRYVGYVEEVARFDDGWLAAGPGAPAAAEVGR